MNISPSLADSPIGLKGIADLQGLHFLIPQYQRGYRWTESQVTDLLEDLLHFQKTAPSDTFYCLQPMLVKRQGERWEVIDGQQRLTTIYILVNFIQDNYQRGGQPLFTLDYATRPKSQEFLAAINAEQAADNIDFYFMHQAQSCLAKWFEKQRFPSLAANNIYSTLLERTQVIWYELAPALGGQHEAFIRINSGKIPLTNAELVKALFLKRAQLGDAMEAQRFAQRQLELATEWDMIEARLRQPELWYFLNEEASPQPTRIEFLFDLVVKLDEKYNLELEAAHMADLLAKYEQGLPSEQARAADEYATFRYFNLKLQKTDTPTLLAKWQEVKGLFLLLEEWCNNRDWYHQLGYLITVGVSVAELVKASHARTKTQFRDYVLAQIKQRVSGQLEQWEYGRDYAKLRNVLLLFNIETLHQNQGASYRFPFQHYKGSGRESQRWSLEHIHAQNARGLGGRQAYQQWLRDVRPYVADQLARAEGKGSEAGEQPTPVEPVLTELDRLLQQTTIDKDDFEQVQRRVFALLGEPELHTIENLALLAATDNATLSNGVFPQKRRLIMELEREGSFIPITTRNVFLKYYPADRQQYVQAIRTTLAAYLTPAPTPADAN
jgi:hypothetical protein